MPVRIYSTERFKVVLWVTANLSSYLLLDKLAVIVDVCVRRPLDGVV